MPATGARSDDCGARGKPLNFLNQRLRDLERKRVTFAHGAERPGHAATGAIEQSHLAARKPQGESAQKARVGERFNMAMGMNDDLAGTDAEPKGAWLARKEILEELFEQKAAACDAFPSPAPSAHGNPRQTSSNRKAQEIESGQPAYPG